MHFFFKSAPLQMPLHRHWHTIGLTVSSIASRCSKCKLLTSDFDALPEKELEMKLLEDWNALKSELPFF